ncbi:PIN domain-containing protein [Methylobacterium sp. sgz302541]|uniref:PIN domain-containing protein n=2 Tax=unclassified Methylobacterium TaxID=2615210 RepID=UPI003D34D8B1
MTDRLFCDTNLLIYAIDPRDPAKRAMSAELISRGVSQRRLVLSPQILNECYWVLVHKRRMSPSSEAERYLAAFLPSCTAPLDGQTHAAAIAIERRHRLSWWDSLALASALQAGCRFFVSEDMKDGQTVDALQIINPFTPHGRTALALT